MAKQKSPQGFVALRAESYPSIILRTKPVYCTSIKREATFASSFLPTETFSTPSL